MVNAAGHHLFVELNSKAYHGISVGNCEIIYYSGSAAGPGVGTVKKTSRAEFSRGRPVYMELHLDRRFSAEASVERAESFLGKRTLALFDSCYDFVEWCIEGLDENTISEDAEFAETSSA